MVEEFETQARTLQEMEEQVRSYESAGKLEAAARLHEQMVLLQVCVHALVLYGLCVLPSIFIQGIVQFCNRCFVYLAAYVFSVYVYNVFHSSKLHIYI